MLWQWPKKVSKKKMSEREKIFRFSIFLELPRRGREGEKYILNISGVIQKRIMRLLFYMAKMKILFAFVVQSLFLTSNNLIYRLS